jgi:hypothetical protein
MCAERNSWGQTIFADDIRFEIGGKYSIMGVYNVDMLIPNATFPLTLPKLCMLIKYTEIKGAFNDDVSVSVFFPSDSDDVPSFSTTIPKEGRETAYSPNAPVDDSERVFEIAMPLIFSPVNIMQEGSIKVRVKCGDNITKLGRLAIRSADPSEIAMPTNWSPPSV